MATKGNEAGGNLTPIDENNSEVIVTELEHNRRIADQTSYAISPQSSVPEHLQEKDFDSDVWDRVVRHPIGNPSLRKNVLNKDPEARELVRQVLAAANEREKEVLLHNQARVFSQVLARTVDSVRSFMNTPLPHYRNSANNSPPVPPNIDNGTGASGIPDEDRPLANSLWPNFWLALVTPKYIFALVALVFGVLAGYSQLQIQNMEKAIGSYQEAQKSFESNNKGLKSQLENIANDKALGVKENENLTERLAILEKEKRDIELSRIRIQSDLDSHKSKNVDLESQIKSARNEETSIVSDLRKQLEEKSNLVSDLKTSLATYKSELSSTKTRKDEAIKSSKEFRKFAESRSKQLEELRSHNQSLAVSNQRLKNKNVLIDFAETFVDKMRDQVGTFSNPNEKEIKQYLKEYDTARKNLL